MKIIGPTVKTIRGAYAAQVYIIQVLLGNPGSWQRLWLSSTEFNFPKVQMSRGHLKDQLSSAGFRLWEALNHRQFLKLWAIPQQPHDFCHSQTITSPKATELFKLTNSDVHKMKAWCVHCFSNSLWNKEIKQLCPPKMISRPSTLHQQSV